MQNQHAHTQSLQEKPEVTFIVTAYNLPAEMLRECLKSILALDFDEKRREIILIDDGSDETPLTELKDLVRHIIYYRQDNQGVSAARNAGLRIATGKFIQFIDGDDLLIPENYQHCLKILDEKQPDMLFFNMTTKQKSVKSEIDCKGPFQGSDYMRHHNIQSSVCSYIFHRCLLGNLHFTVNKQFTEDEEFTPMLLLRSEKLYKTEVKAYFYRRPRIRSRRKVCGNASTTASTPSCDSTTRSTECRKPTDRRCNVASHNSRWTTSTMSLSRRATDNFSTNNWRNSRKRDFSPYPTEITRKNIAGFAA